MVCKLSGKPAHIHPGKTTRRETKLEDQPGGRGKGETYQRSKQGGANERSTNRARFDHPKSRSAGDQSRPRPYFPSGHRFWC